MEVREIAARPTRRRTVWIAAAAAMVATGLTVTASNTILASDEAGGSPVPPGVPFVDGPTGAEFEAPVAGGNELVATGGTNFDPTILTKYISAHGFQALQGASSAEFSVVDLGGFGACVRPVNDAAASNVALLHAPVELPDGARINRVVFFGSDTSPAHDITVRLIRHEHVTPLVSTLDETWTTERVVEFSTASVSGDFSITHDRPLAEITGSFANGSPVILSNSNRFHTLQVLMVKAAAVNHRVCGMRVDYQIPVPANAGVEYNPIAPMRVFDSRISSYPESGQLSRNGSKVIDVTDGHNLEGVPIPAQNNAVPSNATAVTYNITVTGQTGGNFMAVTEGDATEFTTSAINFGAAGGLANAGTVPITNGEIKVWGGDQTGAAHVIIDITGYYAPTSFPNMAN